MIKPEAIQDLSITNAKLAEEVKNKLLNKVIVDALPIEGSSDTLYLVPSLSEGIYYAYFYVDNKWEKVGGEGSGSTYSAGSGIDISVANVISVKDTITFDDLGYVTAFKMKTPDGTIKEVSISNSGNLIVND